MMFDEMLLISVRLCNVFSSFVVLLTRCILLTKAQVTSTKVLVIGALQINHVSHGMCDMICILFAYYII